jgi:K+-transporting ATPase ATPase C chain
MFSTLRQAVVMFLVLTAITGVAYPLAITGLGQVVFRHQANGSLVERDGRIVGSALIGQTFTSAKYFWSRPSAVGYDGGTSGGSNYGPTNPAQLDAVKQRVAVLKQAHGDDKPVPVDLATASGSGLDPHITPAAAEYQVERVAAARGMSVDAVRALIAENTQGRTLGLLGEPRVNLLELNLALDAAQPPAGASRAASDSTAFSPRRLPAGRAADPQW